MDSLRSLMTQLERSPQWRSSSVLRQLLTIWPQLVGASVAQHSQPVKIYRRALQVSVSSAAWAQTLTFERPLILKKLHQKLPAMAHEIQDIKFVTAEWKRTQRQPTSIASPKLADHPCWAVSSVAASNLPPKTAKAAFQKWAERQQAVLSAQSRCPKCQSPCPTQELQRWSMCAICISHVWHLPQAQARDRK